MRIFVAIIIGIAGLLISTCGGVFTVMANAWFISLPSLALGLFLLWVAVKLWKNKGPAASQTEAKPPDPQ